MTEPQKEEPNEEQQHQLSSSAAADPENPAPADRSQDEEERTVTAFEDPPQLPAAGPANFLPHFKRRKFFVLRVNTSAVVSSKSVSPVLERCLYLQSLLTFTYVVSESLNIYPNQLLCILDVIVFATVHTYPIP